MLLNNVYPNIGDGIMINRARADCKIFAIVMVNHGDVRCKYVIDENKSNNEM